MGREWPQENRVRFIKGEKEREEKKRGASKVYIFFIFICSCFEGESAMLGMYLPAVS